MTKIACALLIVLVGGLAYGCGSECSGPACVAAMDSAVADTSVSPDAPDASPDSTMMCRDVATLNLEAVTSLRTDEDANPEIISFIPGSDGRAVLVSSFANQIIEVSYTDTELSFSRMVRVPTGSLTSVLTSVKPSPDGTFAGLTVAEADCGLGRVIFVDISDAATFGDVLGSVDVGYNPDSGAFSADGRYFVSADEDDREDRPCKPMDRFGGSVTVIEIGATPAELTIAQTLPVAHAMDSEPEGVVVSPDGTVIVTVQETNELALFDLDDVPSATLELITLDPEAEPDGIAVSDDSRWVAISQERNDTLTIMDLSTRAIITEYHIPSADDVPSEYHRDASRPLKIHEPEQVTFMRSGGALFLVLALQESHSAIAYLVNDDGTFSFDSIAPSGVDWMDEVGMTTGRSGIRPEGVAANSDRGLVLTANEGEGSITLMRAVPGTDCR